MSTQKNLKTVLYIITIVLLWIVVLFTLRACPNVRAEIDLQKQANQICDECNIENGIVSVVLTEKEDSNEVDCFVNLILPEEYSFSGEDLYNCITRLYEMKTDLKERTMKTEVNIRSANEIYTFYPTAKTLFKNDMFLYCALPDEDERPTTLKEGMKERYIYVEDGQADEVFALGDWDDLKNYEKWYTFYKGSRFRYRRVTVCYWDYENDCPTEGYITEIQEIKVGSAVKPSEPTTAYKGYTPKPSKDDYKDLYDDDYDWYYANEYNDPEDFYEDYYDDFEDFEEAYDYYYDHVD